MRIVRVEHSAVLRDGYPAGPYCDSPFLNAEHAPDDETPWYEWDYMCDEDCIHRWVEQRSWDMGYRTPTPQSDGLYDYDEWREMHFGFRDVSQMREWFRGHMKQLSEYGFIAAVYDVPDEETRHGYRQSVFRYETSVRIGDADIKNYRALERMMQS